jgi:hypothetical protein
MVGIVSDTRPCVLDSPLRRVIFEVLVPGSRPVLVTNPDVARGFRRRSRHPDILTRENRERRGRCRETVHDVPAGSKTPRRHAGTAPPVLSATVT